MNKVEFSTTNKKAAIVSYNTRLTLSSKHIRATGIAYTRDYILKVLNRDICDILSIPHEEDDTSYYKDIRDFESGKLNINNYDEIFIYNGPMNIYGGVFPIPSIPTMLALTKFTGDIWYVLTDPSLPPNNVSLLVQQKFKYCDVPDHVKMIDKTLKKVTQKDIEDFTHNVYEKTKIAFCGLDYKKYYDGYNPDKRVEARKIYDADWAYFGLLEYYAINEFLDLKLQTPEKEGKLYDFAYCGNHRTSRDEVVRGVVGCKDLKCATVGYGDIITGENLDIYPYMYHTDMFNFMNKQVYSTIIMGDNLHNNNMITARFYESMLLNIVAFIWHKYDADKQFVKNQELKDFIYISSFEEYHDKLLKIKEDKDLFNHLVSLERKEVLDFANIDNVDEYIKSINTDVLGLSSRKVSRG